MILKHKNAYLWKSKIVFQRKFFLVSHATFVKIINHNVWNSVKKVSFFYNIPRATLVVKYLNFRAKIIQKIFAIWAFLARKFKWDISWFLYTFVMFELFLSQFEKVIFKMVSFIFLICVICTVNAQEEILPANPHEFPYQVELKALIHIASGAVLDQVSQSILFRVERRGSSEARTEFA